MVADSQFAKYPRDDLQRSWEVKCSVPLFRQFGLLTPLILA